MLMHFQMFALQNPCKYFKTVKKKLMILLNFMATITKTSIKKCIDVVYFKIKKVRKYLVLM